MYFDSFFIELYVVLEAIILFTTKSITPKMYILMHLSTDFFFPKSCENILLYVVSTDNNCQLLKTTCHPMKIKQCYVMKSGF